VCVQIFAGEIGQPGGEAAKILKSKAWQSVVEQLMTQDSKPMYSGKPLCTKCGMCGVNGDIIDGSSIS
jgi:hypothetical protein